MPASSSSLDASNGLDAGSNQIGLADLVQQDISSAAAGPAVHATYLAKAVGMRTSR